MNKFEKLISDHAFWSDEIKRLKEAGRDEFEKCTSLDEHQLTCINMAYQDWVDDKSNGFYSVDFEEVYAELVTRGEICEHCIELRKLRKQRIAARRRLGQIRSAITMAGRKIRVISEEIPA